MAFLRKLTYFTVEGIRFVSPEELPPSGARIPWTLAAMQGQTDEVTFAHAGKSYREAWPLDPNRLYQFGNLCWVPLVEYKP